MFQWLKENGMTILQLLGVATIAYIANVTTNVKDRTQRDIEFTSLKSEVDQLKSDYKADRTKMVELEKSVIILIENSRATLEVVREIKEEQKDSRKK